MQFKASRAWLGCALAAAGPLALVVSSQTLVRLDPPEMPTSLRVVKIPKPNPSLYAADETALVMLGKALFWDMQVGSDGIQACATCHFHAGADHRIHNAVNPGPSGVFKVAPPNAQLTAASFPFHRLSNPDDPNSVYWETDNRAGSAGVVKTRFLGSMPADPASDRDKGSLLSDPVFQSGGIPLRQVEPRNTPTAINAVFLDRNFWDGRASFYFNGASPFGPYDKGARVLQLDSYGNMRVSAVSLTYSSLASQAVGPPLSDFEMSWGGRTWPQLGRKMLKLAPLAGQYVHPGDSVLGAYARPGSGLNVTYSDLIKRAFLSKFWNSTKTVVISSTGALSFKSTPPAAANEFTMMEYNFSFFFGLAVQAYEATLVSDDAPFDRYRGDQTRFPDPAALDDEQKLGLDLFLHKGRCISCHVGAEFTGAAISHLSSPEESRIERMTIADARVVLYDSGFYNIGLRPTAEDIGQGGRDPWGNPLSLTRLKKEGKLIAPTVNFNVSPGDPDAVDGATKTPTLRNVEFTGPYFKNGGETILEGVVEFYDRGGNFRNPELHADIRPLLLTAAEVRALVAFLRSLSDDRVRYEKAPFDHPQLWVPNGHPLDATGRIALNRDGRPKDTLCEVPAVGAAGGPPLQTFQEMLLGVVAGRAHTLTNCVVK